MIENKVCLRLKRNPLLYYTEKGPSIYPQVFEYGVVSDLQLVRSTGLYEEITDIPKITQDTIHKYKFIRASSLPQYGNTFSKKYNMWNNHILSPNYMPKDSDAINLGSFIHLLFEWEGEPPADKYICEDWGTKTRLSVKYDKIREKYGYGMPIVNSEENILCRDIYRRAIKELSLYKNFVLGESKEQVRHQIPNYLNTGWALTGSLDRVFVGEDGIHYLRDIKSVDPSQLYEWESGSYSLSQKFLQLEAYRILYANTYNIPLEKIHIGFVLIIRSVKNIVLGNCVRILTPTIQHTESKLSLFENMFKDIAKYFESRLNNEIYETELVKYNPIKVKTSVDINRYKFLFESFKNLCIEYDISFQENIDYFDFGEYKVLTYKLLINILYILGYEINIITVRENDVLKYTSKDGLYYRQYELNSLPEDKILYYCCEIKKINDAGILNISRLTDLEVSKYSQMFSSYSKKTFWKLFYNQMANVTVIKHSIKMFVLKHDLLKTFFEIESMTYEGIKGDTE